MSIETSPVPYLSLQHSGLWSGLWSGLAKGNQHMPLWAMSKALVGMIPASLIYQSTYSCGVGIGSRGLLHRGAQVSVGRLPGWTYSTSVTVSKLGQTDRNRTHRMHVRTIDITKFTYRGRPCCLTEIGSRQKWFVCFEKIKAIKVIAVQVPTLLNSSHTLRSSFSDHTAPLYHLRRCTLSIEVSGSLHDDAWERDAAAFITYRHPSDQLMSHSHFRRHVAYGRREKKRTDTTMGLMPWHGTRGTVWTYHRTPGTSS